MAGRITTDPYQSYDMKKDLSYNSSKSGDRLRLITGEKNRFKQIVPQNRFTSLGDHSEEMQFNYGDFIGKKDKRDRRH